jgi:hypothetical protein
MNRAYEYSMHEEKRHIFFGWERQKERDHLDVGKKVRVLDGSWRNRTRWYGMESSGSRETAEEGSCEDGNEPSGSIKCWEILERLSSWRLLKKNPAPYCLLFVNFVSNRNLLASLTTQPASVLPPRTKTTFTP